jgi:hypothetical protein
MTGTFLPMPVLRAVDANGAPLPGAQLQFYATGTTTPANVYTSASLGTPLSNPVVADSGGLFAPIFLDPTVTYRCQLLTASGTLIRDIDPVAAPVQIGSGAVTGAMLASGAAVNNIGYTPLNKAGDTATNLLVQFTGSLQPYSAGYMCVPVNEQDGSYTLVQLDAGRMVRGYITSAATYTVPPNTFPLGAVVVIRNAANSTAVITITRGAGVTIYGAGGSTNKDWALAAGGLATIMTDTTNTWVISGTGLS